MERRIRFLIGACLVAALVAGNILTSQAEATMLFEAKVDYGAGDSPFSVAIGDLNGDGHPDLAVANSGSNNVSVLVGNGDGSFQGAVNYDASSNPYSVAIGDLNGDGHPDLAVANYGSNNVSVLLGNGNGTFQAAVNYDAASNPCSVAIGDLNGDGHPDLAVANYGSNNVSVLVGNGDGSFQGAVNYDAGSTPCSVAIGDLNGNVKPDLAVSNIYSHDVSVLLGNGDGTFRAAVNYSVGAYAWAMSVAIGDLDGDNVLDLAVAVSSSPPTGRNVSVLLGKGNGTFRDAVKYNTGDGMPTSVAIGDLDEDNALDLAVAVANPNPPAQANVSVLLGKGDGTFQTAVSYDVRDYPASVAIGDLDGDNDLDLAVANFAGYVSVLINVGSCATPSTPSLSSPSNGATNVSTTPTLSWGTVSGASSYDVQVCTDSGCSSVVTSATDLTVPQWTVSPALNQGITYFWCARANDPCGPSLWATAWSFTTSGSDFVLISPTNNSQVSSPPTFQWTSGPYDVFAFFSYFYYPGHGYYLYPPKGKSFLWLNSTSFTMPVAWWNKLAVGQPQYWTVLGANKATKKWEVASPWSFKRVEFQGGTFDFNITAMDQQPSDCLMPQYLLDFLVSMLQPVVVPVDLPPENEYPASVSLLLPPPIGSISFTARFVGGQVVCDSTRINGIDLGSLGIPVSGLNCLLQATGSGGTTVLTQSNAEAVINLTNMSATIGSGYGPCYLNPRGCTVSIALAGGKACSDIDRDGYGYPGNSRCQHPEEDCNDTNPAVNFGVLEGPPGDPVCTDGIDNNCDGKIDLDDPGCVPCVDNDGDGYGNPANVNCPHPELDCDESNPDVHPGATEGPEGDPTCSDGLDNDCDGIIDSNDPSCKSLVAFYPFNGNANDESGNGHDGTVNGAVLISDRFGNPDSAYSFDGVDDCITVPSAPDLEMGDEISIAAWINCSGGYINPRIVEHGYVLYTGGTSDNRQIGFEFGDGYISSGEDNTVTCGEWHFVVATATPSKQRIYLDGKLVNRGPGSTVAPVYNTDLYIGMKPTELYDDWGGLLDDIQIYNRALSRAEIQALYNVR